ncbi:peptidoglycan-binding domain-containing protein [Streptomyces canus]
MSARRTRPPSLTSSTVSVRVSAGIRGPADGILCGACLNAWGFNAGTEGGQLGTNSWKAAQRMLNAWGYNAGTVDGAVGPNTIRALQKFLNAVGENAGTPDGIAGPQTRAAFWNYNATGC